MIDNTQGSDQKLRAVRKELVFRLRHMQYTGTDLLKKMFINNAEYWEDCHSLYSVIKRIQGVGFIPVHSNTLIEEALRDREPFFFYSGLLVIVDGMLKKLDEECMYEE